MDTEILLYSDGSRPRPKFRGVLHEIVFLSFPVWSFEILRICHTQKAILSVLAFVLSVIICFGASSQYHRRNVSPTIEMWLSRFDMAGIFVMIAYNLCPVFVFLIPEMCVFILSIMSIFCACGIAIAINRPPLCCNMRISKINMTFIYLIMGFGVTVLILPKFIERANDLELWCWGIGAFFYGTGTLIFVFEIPNPYPDTFGYHEIFHACTTISGILTYVTNYSIVKRLQ